MDQSLLTFLNEFLFGAPTGENPSDIQLNRLGSVMGSAKANPRANANRQGPALATGDKLIQSLNPIDWMGGFGGGGSGATLGPIRSQVQKQIIKSLAKNAPDLLDAIVKSPAKTTFQSKVPWSNPRASGMMEGGNLIPDKMITISPDVMRGKLPAAVTSERPGLAGITGKQDMFANTPGVIAHEAQHSVNRDIFPGLMPDELYSIAKRTVNEGLDSGPKVPLGAPGADQIITNTLDVGPYAGADEALAYLRQHQVAKTPDSLPTNDFLQAMLDEISSLTGRAEY